jgi:hypothetical protein
MNVRSILLRNLSHVSLPRARVPDAGALSTSLPHQPSPFSMFDRKSGTSVPRLSVLVDGCRHAGLCELYTVQAFQPDAQKRRRRRGICSRDAECQEGSR